MSSLTSKIENKEAEACKNRAEELFKEKKIDSAICAIDKARQKNPNHVDLNSHFACYVVHKLAAEKKSWYAVLGIRDHGSGAGVIKNRYEGMAQLFKRSNCSSVARGSAIKLIDEAWAVLSDAKRREAYDILMGYNDNVKSQNLENFNTPSTSARIRRNSTPAPSPLHKTKKATIIRRNGENRGINGNKVFIIAKKSAMMIVVNA